MEVGRGGRISRAASSRALPRAGRAQRCRRRCVRQLRRPMAAAPGASAQRLAACLSRGLSLRASIDRAWAADVLAALLFRLMHSTAVLATPIIVFFLLEWFVDDSQPEWPGYCLAAGFGAAGLIAACAQSCSLRCSLASQPRPRPYPRPHPRPHPKQVQPARWRVHAGCALCDGDAALPSARVGLGRRSLESESAHAAARGRVPEAGDGGTASDRMDAVPLGRLAALIGRSSEEVLGYSP